MPPEAISFWVDCGPGVPTQADGSPKDRALFELNYNFAKEYQEQDFKMAAKTLRWMKKRAEEIVSQLEGEAIAYLKLLGYKFD